MKKLKTWCLFISLVILITFRYFSSRPVYKNGDFVRISSTVFSEPTKYRMAQYLKIYGLKIYLPLVPEISYGDKIVIEGEVNDDKLENPKLVNVSRGSSTSKFRNDIVAFYQKVLPEPHAGLIAGIVLGAKKTLSYDFYNQTKFAGVAHVVVASGTNVTFVVSFLMGVVTIFLTRRKAIAFVILGIILYLFIAGFEAPLIRAAIMSSFIFLGQEVGRVVSKWRVFMLTLMGMLAYKPLWICDIGFILSFVSTASLMLFEKKIREKLKVVPEVLKEGLSTSLAAQIGIAPILFVTFGQFNILSPIINALVLWVIPPLMILGALGGVLGLVFEPAGRLILYLSYPLLWWFVEVVQWFG